MCVFSVERCGFGICTDDTEDDGFRFRIWRSRSLFLTIDLVGILCARGRSVMWFGRVPAVFDVEIETHSSDSDSSPSASESSES